MKRRSRNGSNRQRKALRLAKKFFGRKLPAKGTFVAVEFKSGDCFCQKNLIQDRDAMFKAREIHPDGDIHLIRIGYPAALTIHNPYYIPVR